MHNSGVALRLVAWGLLIFVLSSCASPGLKQHLPAKRVESQNVMVSTQGVTSTQAALWILKKGGNVFDAAIAASLAISVERPHSTGLTGGGFAVLYDTKTDQSYAVDFRERAPARAFPKMFLDANGTVIQDKSVSGIYAGAVPGLIAGLEFIHKKWGKLKWSELFEPAIELAENGFAVYPELQEAIEGELEVLQKDPDAKNLFLDSNLKPLRVGARLVQKDLARTLREFQKKGQKAWTQGETGKKFISHQKLNRGFIGIQDLTQYQARLMKPIKGEWKSGAKSYEIVSMPPPSSGGVLLIQMLNMLEEEKLSGAHSAETIHRLASAMQLAYADRAAWLGDPKFFNVPVKGLVSKKYAMERWKQYFNSNVHYPSEKIFEGDPRKIYSGSAAQESDQTMHLSIMDQEGNTISTTQTINGHFGAGMVVPGTGMVLNNEMDDFSAKPGSPNIFGALGGKANEPNSRKTPLSSMTPTIVFEKTVEGKTKPVFVVGSPSGTRIITCVMQVMMGALQFGLPLEQAQSMVRIHHQWKPDVLTIEKPGLNSSVNDQLKAMGYSLQEKSYSCRVQAIQRLGNGKLVGVSDPRGEGLSMGL